MPVEASAISGRECLKIATHLHNMGIRFAGSPGEKEAADWIEQRYRQLGLQNIWQQEFPCLTYSYGKCEVAVLSHDGWQTIPSEPAAHSPSTPGGTVEGDLMVVEKIPENAATAQKMLAGKIGLIYVSELFQLERLKRVMGARPAGLLAVDDRFPNEWNVGVGFPRYWIDFLSCPIINVSYRDAWEIVQQGSSRVRLELDASVQSAVSQNVIGELPGTDLSDEVIIISAHHDSVLNNPGADDNGTGVAAVLELARAFVDRPHRRTLRFISYGTEEQLSEGARYYAENAADLDRIQFVLNVDSIGAIMGQTVIFYAGSPDMEKLVRLANETTNFPGHICRELSPFSDHFPLNVRGIPAVWYYRKTFAGARHYHHSVLETPEVLSPSVLENTVRHQAVLLEEVSNAQPLPFANRISDEQMTTLKQMGVEWFGYSK